MAKQEQGTEPRTKVMVRRGKSVVHGEPDGVRITYIAGDIAELPVSEARRLEGMEIVDFLEEVD